MLHEGDGAVDARAFSFIEMSAVDQLELDTFLTKMGFTLVGKHATRPIFLFKQGHIHVVANYDPKSYAFKHATQKKCHTLTGIGFHVSDAKYALKQTSDRGGEPSKDSSRLMELPAVVGPGGELIYLMDDAAEDDLFKGYFTPVSNKIIDTQGVGLQVIDHITINCERDTLSQWHEFFIKVFGFDLWTDYEVNFSKTWYRFSAIISKNSKIRLPMNEPRDDISTVAEFVKNHGGTGSQHVAFQAADIIDSVSKLGRNGIEFLEVPEVYFDDIEERLPGHGLDLEAFKAHQVLIDGMKDDNGKYLLLEQIFTKMMIKPLFFEVIKRKGNKGFGEGNVNALSKALEVDQIKRGVLKNGETISE